MERLDKRLGVIPDFAITILRAVIVAAFTGAAWRLCADGVTAADLVELTILAVVSLVSVVAADWVNHGVRPGKEDDRS